MDNNFSYYFIVENNKGKVPSLENDDEVESDEANSADLENKPFIKIVSMTSFIKRKFDMYLPCCIRPVMLKKLFLLAVLIILCPMLFAQSSEQHPMFEPLNPEVMASQNNLFFNAKVTVSGSFENDRPELAVDGNVDPDKYWGAENLPVWLQIDMGGEKSLSVIHIWPYWKDGRIYKYKIEGSQDGQTWKMLVDQTANSITGTKDGSAFTFKPVNVRYVRTTILENSRGAKSGGHIVEIQGFEKHEKAVLSGSAVSENARVPQIGIPDEKTRLQQISATTWRGERVNGQIALWSNNNLEQISLKATHLTSAKGEKIPLQVSFVRFTRAKDKFYADIIDPIDRVDLPGGTTRTVWVTADIPAETSPGIYKGEVLARAKGGSMIKVPVSVEVLYPVLPPASKWKCHLDLWQHPAAVARWHDVPMWSDEHFALLKPIMKRLADAGQKNITCSLLDEAWNAQTYDWWPSMIQWNKNSDGSMSYDYTIFDKWVSFMLNDVKLNGMITCYTMIPWSMKVRYYDTVKEDYDFIELDPQKPSYEAVWGPFLSDFRKHVKAKGWIDRTCIGIDERPDHMVSAAKAILDKYAPEFKIVSAVNNPTELTRDVYDLSVIIYHANTVFGELVAKRRAEGKKTTFYVCVVPGKPNTFTDSPLVQSEWLGFFAAANHLDGFLRWAYNSWSKDPFDTTDYANFPPGDCFLVYPGNLSSLRFEKLRDGLEELEKVNILRAKATLPNANAAFKQSVTEMDELLAKLFTIEKSREDHHHADDLRQAIEAVNKASMLLK